MAWVEELSKTDTTSRLDGNTIWDSNLTNWDDGGTIWDAGVGVKAEDYSEELGVGASWLQA